METLQSLFYGLTHIDQYLIALVTNYGVWTYVALFLVIFLETGLVIFPFLPGDSLIFAAGSLTANTNGTLDVQVLFVILILASILGNKLNFLIGRFIGPKVFRAQKSRIFNRKHLQEAHDFYEKHGGKTIIIARFIPIFRTFVPFVAGIGNMSLSHFSEISRKFSANLCRFTFF